MRRGGKLSLGAIAGFVAASVTLGSAPARAVPITYTETDTASGSLGGVAFTNATIVLTENSDTTNVTTPSSGDFDNFGTVTLSINGGTAVTFKDQTAANSVQSSAVGVFAGFYDQNSDSIILGDVNSVFSTYSLTTAIGPITATSSLFLNNSPLPTTGGSLILSSVGNPTFTATFGTTAVPAPPIGQGLPVLLAVGGLLFGAKLLERGKRRRLQFG